MRKRRDTPAADPMKVELGTVPAGRGCTEGEHADMLSLTLMHLASRRGGECRAAGGTAPAMQSWKRDNQCGVFSAN